MKSLAGLGFLLAISLAIFILDNHLFIFKNVSRVGENFFHYLDPQKFLLLVKHFRVFL